MKNEDAKVDEHLVRDIMNGIKKAVSKLISETAVRNGSLVVECDGKIVHVPAKQLLQALNDNK